jgi:hypothetical protein
MAPTSSAQFEPFVNAVAVAAHLAVTKRQILNWTRAGAIPAHPIDPNAERKTWRYRLSEISAAIDKSSAIIQDGPVLGSPQKARNWKQ